MWGRLDAVPALLELLVTPDSLRTWLSRQDDDPLTAVGRLVLGPDVAANADLREFLKEHVWTGNIRTAVKKELDALADTGTPGAVSGPFPVQHGSGLARG